MRENRRDDGGGPRLRIHFDHSARRLPARLKKAWVDGRNGTSSVRRKASVLLAGGDGPQMMVLREGCGKSVRTVRGDRLLIKLCFVLCWWRWAASRHLS